jgi:hypothetical protein
LNQKLNKSQAAILKTLCNTTGCDETFEHKAAILTSANNDLVATVEITGISLARLSNKEPVRE